MREYIQKRVKDDAVYRFIDISTKVPEDYEMNNTTATPEELAEWFMDNVDFFADELRLYLKEDK